MKKIVIILLTVLPIFLIVVISFAGRVFSEVSHISVEKVVFVDKTENPLTDKYTLSLNVGESHQLIAKVYPELASNKKVIYTSSDESVCTVDQNGLVTAKDKPGTALIVVKTEEKGITDRITVVVSKSVIESVRITDANHKDFEIGKMSVGETIKLYNDILPVTVLNKKVIWSSSDENIVFVDSRDGTIVARAPGKAIITVTTVDGGLTDTCEIIVDNDKPKLGFDFSKDANFDNSGLGYLTSIKEFNINDYLVYDSTVVNPEDIVISINKPSTYDSTTGMIVINQTGIVIITASLNDGSGISVSVTLLVQ